MTIEQKIWQAALKKLKVKLVSIGEMKQILSNQFKEAAELIHKAIEELKRLNLLNDERLLEQMIDHLTQKFIGRFKMENEIKKRYLDTEKVDDLLAQKGWSEKESAKKAMEVKNRTLREKNPQKRKQKTVMFLKSRGFSNDVIYSLISVESNW